MRREPALMYSSIALMLFCHASLAQYPNIRVSNPSSITPEEVTIAINPANPMNLVAGANIRFNYFSTDGGMTWTQGFLPTGTWGDPCVMFDAEGRGYYGHLSNPAGGYFIERLIVHRSSNGGLTWSDSTTIGYNPPKQQDKEWLVADMTSSPFRDNIYMSWTEFDAYGSTSVLDSSRILFSHSTDHGASWSNPVRVSDTGGDCIDEDNTVEGAVPAVGPNGEVYVGWSGPLGIMFDKSTDGGQSFGSDVFVSLHPGGWDFAVSGIYRCNGLPITACDASTSPYRGNIYITWGDQRNGVENSDVFMSKSTDGGSTWGITKKVNNDAGARHQFFPWMTVDQSTGYLYFVFYDRRGTKGDTTNVYVAKSTDGGETFSNFKVSTSPFAPTSNIFFGDYTNIAAMNGRIYPIWMRLDGNSLSVWTALLTDTTTVDVSEDHGQITGYKLWPNYPNPFNPSTTIHFDVPEGSWVTLKLFDILGREVSTLVDQYVEPGRHAVQVYAEGLSSGLYCCTMVSGHFVDMKKMMVMK